MPKIVIRVGASHRFVCRVHTHGWIGFWLDTKSARHPANEHFIFRFGSSSVVLRA